MQPLSESIARTEALRAAHVTRDPPSADMLDKLTAELRDIASTSASLRDRIDIKLGVVARPVSQVDGS